MIVIVVVTAGTQLVEFVFPVLDPRMMGSRFGGPNGLVTRDVNCRVKFSMVACCVLLASYRLSLAACWRWFTVLMCSLIKLSKKPSVFCNAGLNAVFSLCMSLFGIHRNGSQWSKTSLLGWSSSGRWCTGEWR